ncbi:MAG: hypothetical protein ACFFBP_15160 [Promethearchaeota archaeon]
MKKYIACLIVTALSFAPLLFTAIYPHIASTRLHVNAPIGSIGYKIEYVPQNYVVSLTAGNYYTIKYVMIPSSIEHIGIRIGDTPYMITGQEFINTDLMNKTIVYFPHRSGDHYIQVFGPGKGGYGIIVEYGQTASPNGVTIPFFNGIYLLGFILPTLIVAFVANFITLLAMRERPSSRKYKFEQPIPVYMGGPAKQAEIKNLKPCQNCGTKFGISFKYCPNCGMQRL